MKKNRRSCVTFILLAGGVFGLLLIAGLIYYFYNNFGPNKPVTPLGPTILVTSPTSDQADIPVEALIVEATAMGDAPVGRLELWLDGELHSDILSESPEGVEIFTGTFNLPLTKGSHMLFVRAVDTNNLIGQSFPIFATGAFSMTAEGPVILADTNGAARRKLPLPMAPT
ncbi:MAG: hypothetical protein MUO77_14620 [Anaerolineales bacterium]|nr:hypothetical protein [Anaerolineales bacterium]